MNGEFYNHDEVKKIIADYCQTHKINKSVLAGIIGIHPTSLSRIQAGEHCSQEHLQIIAALGGKQPDELVRKLPEDFNLKISTAISLKKPLNKSISV